MVALVAPVTAVVLIGKVAVVVPSGMTTLTGTCAAALPLVSVTVTPPAGAAVPRVTVPVEESPSTTEAGLRVTDESDAGVSVSVPMLVTLPWSADTVTGVDTVTTEVVTGNVAVVAPAAIVTEEGTDACKLLLERPTLVAVVTEALSLTVPVEPRPPTTDVGLKVTVRARTERLAVRVTPP